MTETKTQEIQVVAFYLPQYHPVKENDDWWGKGFTEWRNVAKAKALFRGHNQPRVPADLGYYDLRLPEVREAQANLAAQYGITAFCYWHYWFAGRRLLERPFEEVLQSKKPDFPFCLAWANDTWAGVWHGADNRTLLEQTYPGTPDYKKHFEYLLKAFRDERYLRIDGKPLFAILNPTGIPGVRVLTDYWRGLAVKAGLPGLHLVALADCGDLPKPFGQLGFDAVASSNQTNIHAYVRFGAYRSFLREAEERWRRNGKLSWKRFLRDSYTVYGYKVKHRIARWRGKPVNLYRYKDAARFFLPSKRFDYEVPKYPVLVPNWDHSPRCGNDSVILHGSTPELFREHAREVFDYAEANFPEGNRIVFAKSWNEWAEGNYLEPDVQYGRAYLEALKEELEATNQRIKGSRIAKTAEAVPREPEVVGMTPPALSSDTEKTIYELILPGATYSPWNQDEAFLKTHRAIQANTLVDLYRCYEIWNLVQESAKLGRGSLIEVGVWRGGTGALIASQALSCGISEPVYLCDTFTGVVKAGGNDSSYTGGEHSDTSEQFVHDLLLTQLRLTNVQMLKGIFPEQTASRIENSEFRFCHIDVDVYESARDIFTWVWERMVPGGIFVFDDYGFESCSGVTKLVNELRQNKGTTFVHNLNGHAIAVKL